MKNIVFDLGGVVFERDPKKCTAEFTEFFNFLKLQQIPHFWNEYDRGTLTMDETTEALARYHDCDIATARRHMRTAIDMQEEIVPTRELVAQLKAAGYRLYVLSNMSLEFIAHLRRLGVYAHFEGDVVSCEVKMLKPEPQIYLTLLERYSLSPAQTLFIDDRTDNIEAAARCGITGFRFERGNPARSCEQLRRMLL